MLSAPPDCVWTPCPNCLMRKRIASKALWDLIAKFIQPSWKTTRKNIVWLLQLFVPFLSKQLLSAAYFLILVDYVMRVFFVTTSRSLLPCALLWCIFCPASYIPLLSPLLFGWALAMASAAPLPLAHLWPGNNSWFSHAWFPADTSQKQLGPLGWGGRIQKGSGKQKVKLSPAGLAALHPL